MTPTGPHSHARKRAAETPAAAPPPKPPRTRTKQKQDVIMHAIRLNVKETDVFEDLITNLRRQARAGGRAKVHKTDIVAAMIAVCAVDEILQAALLDELLRNHR